MTTKVQTSAYKSLPDCELITDPVRLARVLERLARRYTPLTVQIPGHKEQYTSCIVEVDKPYVLLDELIPSSGHQLLLKKRELQVTGKLEGVDIQFTTSLERVDDKKNVLTYYMNLPRQLEFLQRRQAYRVNIPISKNLRVIIDNRDGTVIEGVLHDLSHGGAGIIIPEGIAIMKPGLLNECAIELPDNEWLYCTVEMRYLKNISPRDQQLIGARFNDFSSAQSRLIGRLISELEREFIRKRAAY